MSGKVEGQLIPYDLITAGWEAEYTGGDDLTQVESQPYFTYETDAEGNVYVKYSLWGFMHLTEESWNDEIRYINAMQTSLGPLNEDTRRLRQQIGGLVCCDSGVPTTIDEILNAVSKGKLPEESFHAGCWMHTGLRMTQPHHLESMVIIEEILKGFTVGMSDEMFLTKYPYAKGFIERTYKWLGSIDQFTQLQKLMMKRVLLYFEFFTKKNEDIYDIALKCFEEGGQGKEIDKEISGLVGIPKIYSSYSESFYETLNSIEDEEKKEVYKICGSIAGGVYELSDCHHNTFRVIERWIHGIGTLKWDIPTRQKSSEEKRLGKLLFGYVYGIDKWLQGIPLQFLLLDLDHLELGFNPRNEIQRVYAYLGSERTPVKKWLVACLWYNLALNPNGGLYTFANSHKEIIETIDRLGLSIREWIDDQMKKPL